MSPVHVPSSRPSYLLGRRTWVRRWLFDRLGGSGVLSVLDQAVVSGTGFATSVLIGRLASPAELGAYYLALSVVLFVRGIQEQLVSAPFTVYSQRHHGRRLEAYTGSTLVHQGLLTVAALAVLAVVGAAACARGGSGSIRFPAVVAVLAAMPFLLLREHIRQLTFARFHIATVIAIDVAVAVFQIGGLAVLACCGWLSVAAVYAVMGAACLVACTGWVLRRRHLFHFERAQFWPDWRYNWQFGRWMLASHLVGSSAPYVMPWFVAALRGMAETGVMAACNTLIGLANAFVLGLMNYLSPRTAHAYATGGRQELRRVLLKAVVTFLVTLGAFSLAMMLVGGILAEFVFGESYAAAGGIVSVYALAALASSLAMTAGNGLCAMDRPAANFAADVAALAATTIAAVLLVPSGGVMGAALAALCGNTVDAGIRGVTLTALLRGTLR